MDCRLQVRSRSQGRHLRRTDRAKAVSRTFLQDPIDVTTGQKCCSATKQSARRASSGPVLGLAKQHGLWSSVGPHLDCSAAATPACRNCCGTGASQCTSASLTVLRRPVMLCSLERIASSLDIMCVSLDAIEPLDDRRAKTASAASPARSAAGGAAVAVPGSCSCRAICAARRLCACMPNRRRTCTHPWLNDLRACTERDLSAET